MSKNSTDLRVTHGASNLPLYCTWAHMIKRCYDPKDSRYKWYGAKGVSVFPLWLNSPAAFAEYMGVKPDPTYTIDRIDVYGNYEPGNVRWASRDVQSRNRRVRCTSKLGIPGVAKSKNKYRAYFSINKKCLHLGMFATLEEAVAVRKSCERHYRAKTRELLK